MKKLVWALFIAFVSLPLYAQDKRHNFEVAYEVSDYKYEEPHMANRMSLSGHKMGISASYLRRSILSPYVNEQDPTFGAVELRYMTGNVDYDGYLNTDPPTKFDAGGIRDYYVEAVLKTGWIFKPAHSLELSPYLGVGWRHLRNHLEQSGDSGYLRDSTYVYMPLGALVTYRVTDGFSLTFTGEFDWLLTGRQYSDIGSGLTHDQAQGYGLRGGIKAKWEGPSVGVFVEPFWRFWHIQNSDEVIIYNRFDGKYYATREPFNRTNEYGLRLGITF